MQILSGYSQRLASSLRQSLPERGPLLLVCDQFSPSQPGELPHGQLVAQVAAQAGFTGKLLALPFEDPADPGFQAYQDRQAEHVEGWGTASEPAQIRQHLYESMLHTRLFPLNTVTQRLLAATEAGARQAVMNLSLGSTPAQCLMAVLQMCQDPQSSEQARSQLCKAFGVAGDDDHGLHQHLVDTVQSTSADPRLQAAHSDFSRAVSAFEAQGNSVVAAAGNDGNIGKQLAVPVPAGLTRNDLQTPEVTVVGALEGGLEAPYNGELSDGAVLAPGAAFISSLGQTVHGTSFATPRVAAAMALLHAEHPEDSSQKIETRGVQGGGEQPPLDPWKRLRG